uniref:Uncharacterized protein n=1 Tax=Oryza glumipatula TaxID=40148 RepID=A0A0D9Y2Z1_9ORYZ
MAADSCLAAVAAGGGLSRRRTPSRFWWLSSRLLLGLHALEGRGCEGSRTTAVSSRDKKGRMKVIGLAADDPRCSTATDEFKENMYYEQVGEY